MKIKSDSLTKILQTVSKAASSKPTIPILSNIVVKIDKDIDFQATDLELGISTKLILEEELEKREFSISSKLISDFVANLPNSDVEMIIKDNKVILTNDFAKGEFTISGIDNFPQFEEYNDSNLYFEVNLIDLQKTLNKILFAVSVDISRPILTGVLFEVLDNKLTLVGVDGFRLSKKDLEVKSNKNANVVVPVRSLQEILKLNGDVLRMYLIGEHDNKIIFEISNTKVYSRVLDGQFPDYKGIIPKTSSKEFSLDKSSLLSCLRTVNTISRNIIGMKTILKVDMNKKVLNILSRDPDLGVAETNIDIFEIIGENYDTAFNIKYLIDGVNSIESEEIKFKQNGANLPIELIDSKDSNYRHIIMPMRVD